MSQAVEQATSGPSRARRRRHGRGPVSRTMRPCVRQGGRSGAGPADAEPCGRSRPSARRLVAADPRLPAGPVGSADRLSLPPDLLGVRRRGDRAPRCRSGAPLLAARAGGPLQSLGRTRRRPRPRSEGAMISHPARPPPIGKIFQPLLDCRRVHPGASSTRIIPNYPIDVALLTIVIMARAHPADGQEHQEHGGHAGARARR